MVAWPRFGLNTSMTQDTPALHGMITLTDVAKACGVSKRTVSSILNPRPEITTRVGEATRAKVLAAAAHMGWRPNRTVRQFQARRHGAVGLLVESIWRVPSAFLAGVLAQLNARGVHLLLGEMPTDPLQTPLLLAEECVDALIVFSEVAGGIDARPWAAHLDRVGCLVLRVNTNRRSGPGCITYDEEGGARELIARLVARGCTRALFLNCPENGHYSVPTRTEALTAAAAQAGLPLQVVAMPKRDEAACAAVLVQHPACDGVVVYAEHQLLPLGRALRRLGRTATMLSCSGGSIAEAMEPPVACVAVDHEWTVRACIDAIDGGVLPDSLRVPMHLA